MRHAMPACLLALTAACALCAGEPQGDQKNSEQAASGKEEKREREERIELAAEGPLDDANLRPDEVLVIANGASATSVEIARHYMQKRGIPEGNYLALDFPGYKHPAWLPFEEFHAKAVVPLRSFLETNGLKDKILCFVTTWDVPYRSAGPKLSPEEFAEVSKNLKDQKHASTVLTTRASFDSELAWLYRKEHAQLAESLEAKKEFCYMDRNAYAGQPMKFRQFRRQAAQHPRLKDAGHLYMVSRLEAPSVELTKGLVEQALAVELNGPKGRGYFDSKGVTHGNRKVGYPMGEFWARRGYLETLNAGMPAARQETQELFGAGECPDCFLYWGWYALHAYRDAYNGKFAPGAIAVHTASSEAVDIRHWSDKSNNPWCRGFLQHGAAVCTGPVSEPFLGAFPNAELFFPRLFEGWTTAEAYWNSTGQLSWQMVLVGDPLYAPFAGKNRVPHYVQGTLRFAAGEAPAYGPHATPGAVNRVQLILKALGPVFKHGGADKLADPGTNGAKVKLLDLDKATFEPKDDGTQLEVTGLRAELADFGPFDRGAKKGPELEIHVDLGPDGGVKIVSQLLEWK